MSAVPTKAGSTLPGPEWRVGSVRPTAADELPPTWLPTPRMRDAETIANAILARVVAVDRLCAIVGELRRTLGVDHAQVSIISDRQIAVVVDGELADPDAVNPDSASAAVSALENTLCVLAMRADRTIGIDDAAADERVASTPPVAGGEIGSYLGSPIRTPVRDAAQDAVARVGVLCVYHARPHQWTYAEGVELDRVAALVGDELRIVRDAVGAVAP